MFIYKSILLGLMFFISANCGGTIPSLFKKNDNQAATTKEDFFGSEDSLSINDSLSVDDAFEIDTSNVFVEEEDLFAVDTFNDFGNMGLGSEEFNISMTDKVDEYSNVVLNLQDQITKLRSELENVTDEVYNLKAKSQIWENPFSIYNKEIILNNGSTVYGKIVYQDQDILYVETLIGELTIKRNTIKRVVENVTHVADSTTINDDARKKNIVEIQEYRSSIPITSKKLLANAILLGDVSEEVDFRGNRIFRGDIKNTGEARADFVKINFVFRMNWQGKTQSLTAFVRGSKQVLPDSKIESDSSIEPGAIGSFELIIPSNFGTFIGYSYSIDWEQYDD
tara:strand:+ start:1342 stop:2355 length:1014 start_codon:yes stop_codon:yes gene_type:complete